MLDFASLSPYDYADALPREQFMHYGIKPLHNNMQRIAGSAFTVKCEPGDHLMLHAAIYRASPGDIIVAQADDSFALAGGNVCAIAQKRGIAGFVIDGVIRDMAEVREMGFAVFAKGVMPKPGKKACIAPLNQTIRCGGVIVNPNDIIVADEDGIAVIPFADKETVFDIASKRASADASQTLAQWQTAHQKNVESKLSALGYKD